MMHFDREVLKMELAAVFNRNSVEEHYNNTPDYILAEVALKAIEAFAEMSARKESTRSNQENAFFTTKDHPSAAHYVDDVVLTSNLDLSKSGEIVLLGKVMSPEVVVEEMKRRTRMYQEETGFNGEVRYNYHVIWPYGVEIKWEITKDSYLF